MKLLDLIICWSIYLTLHSILASSEVKAFVFRRLPVVKNAYRFIYSFLSTLGFFVLLFWTALTPSKMLFVPGEALRYVAMILASWGVIVIIVSFRQISGLVFLGLKKEEDSRLVTTGIHGWIRHPIYSGTILILIGMFLYNPTNVVLAVVLVIFIYLPVGIYLEERKLMREFGEEYSRYKENVSAIIPWLL